MTDRKKSDLDLLDDIGIDMMMTPLRLMTKSFNRAWRKQRNESLVKRGLPLPEEIKS